MKYKNKIISVFLLSIVFLTSLSCTKQTAQSGNNSNNNSGGGSSSGNAQTPTEAYKMLYAAVKAKDKERIKQMMSKSTLGFAEFSGSQQKKSVDQILENGFVAPTLAPSLTEIRDERVKDNFGAVEVFNPKDNRWEDLPFVLEDGGWKLAVGDVFQNTYKSPGKGRAQIEREASNTEISMPANSVADFPPIPEGNKSVQVPPGSGGTKSVEVPKEGKPKK